MKLKMLYFELGVLITYLCTVNVICNKLFNELKLFKFIFFIKMENAGRNCGKTTEISVLILSGYSKVVVIYEELNRNIKKRTSIEI